MIVLVPTIWKAAAGGKIKKALLAVSESPDDAQAQQFLETTGRITDFGRFLAKHAKTFAGLTKSECRNLYHTTVVSSSRMSMENKQALRARLMSFGCSGLTDASAVK